MGVGGVFTELEALLAVTFRVQVQSIWSQGFVTEAGVTQL